MDERILEFIAALRAAGLRVSVAESIDALRALEHTGVAEQGLLRRALRATLVKERADLPVFERLFPLYFGGNGVTLVTPDDDGALSAAEREHLRRAVVEAAAAAPTPALAWLFTAIIAGEPLRREQLDALLAGVDQLEVSAPLFEPWMARRALREVQFERLEGLLHELLERLRAAGMRAEALEAIARTARLNQEAQAGQIGRAVALSMQRRAATRRDAPLPREELLDRPFHLLDSEERAALRREVARLAARLRAHAALQRRRNRRGALDPRGTLRASLRYASVPVDLRRRRRRLTPRLVILCDLSASMREVASFMLHLVYALHDHIRRARAFAYIAELYDISADFHAARPAEAVSAVLRRIDAAYTATDFGAALQQFIRDHLHTLDRRATVLILGDGRNNRSDPGLAHLRQIKARARQVIWFTPESPRDWGTGDSDLPAYLPLCDSVHVVRNLRQLAEAVERLVLRMV
ncbi:MAG: VWA domain-containing protein [Oscillochloridaceae bacterium]|nr:VWA domain-containing protein [Chloroflexaceae bacterium]MDW8389641.1 VWA domain-containing protein [Oscillochloridaceae bacterium]